TASSPDAPMGDDESPRVAAPLSRRPTGAAAAGTPAGPGSLLVQLTWRPEASAAERPAVGALIELTPAARESDVMQTRAGATDRAGQVRFAALSAGHYRLALPTKVTHVEIAAGEECVLRLELRTVVEVIGKVLDPQGRPVAGAVLWACSFRRSVARRAAVADAHGAFAIVVPKFWFVGAQAPGYCSTQEQVLADTSPVELTLQLPGAGSVVRGSVRDAAGAPVVGALVQVGSEALRASHPELAAWSTTPQQQRTDARGRFEQLGVAPGRLPVAVRATNGAGWRGWVEATAGSAAEIAVTLMEPARIEGLVRDAAGAPIAGAWVQAMDACPLGAARERAGPKGEFSLRVAAPGSVRLEASGAVPELGLVRVTGVASVQPGAIESWQPVLGAVGQSGLRGQVVDASGRGLEGCFVVAQVEATERQLGYVRTDADGRFHRRRFASHEADLLFDVFVYPETASVQLGWPTGPPLAVVRGVRVGEELELRAGQGLEEGRAATTRPPKLRVGAQPAPRFARVLRFRWPVGEPTVCAVRYGVRDAQGRIVARGRAGAEHGPVRATVQLPAGDHILEASTATGLAARLPLPVPAPVVGEATAGALHYAIEVLLERP
ncbi:MAG: carboxypeptidase-like regulatory domain-containing protein, partial [Planctomycetota bacterium]